MHGCEKVGMGSRSIGGGMGQYESLWVGMGL